MRRRHVCLLFLASALPMPALAAGPALQPAQPSWEALLRLSTRLRALDVDGLNPGHYNIPPDARAASDPQGYTTALYAAAYAALGDLLQGECAALRTVLTSGATRWPWWRGRHGSTAMPNRPR
ncbi:hypothetical protein ACFQU7_04880 [Pseudoroseomonas wenyumeiae]